MDLGFWAALVAVSLGGAAIAAQAPVNGVLSRGLGDPVAAAAISFLVGFVVLAVLSVLRSGVPAVGGALAVLPWWAWCGGLLGAWFVTATVVAVGTLGVLTLVAALVFGQLAAALVLDATGAFGVQVHGISATRVAAVVLVGAGLVLSRL